MSDFATALRKRKDAFDKWRARHECIPCQGYGGYMPSCDMYTKETGWQTCGHCGGTGFKKGKKP